MCSQRCLRGCFIYSVVMVTEYIVVGGTGTWDGPEASNPVLRGSQSSRVAGWLKKKREKNWWKLLSPWKQRSQMEAFGSPSIAKTYNTDLIHAWHYYHSVSVRSLLSLRPQGHPACVSKLCASSLTTKQVYAQMEPRGRDNVHLLKTRCVPPDDLTAVISSVLLT